MSSFAQKLKRVWHFLWHEDSVWSWIANIVIAFILIKFVVYPLISLLLATPLPIVAVVSGSMEHKYAPLCNQYLANGLCITYSSVQYDLCGNSQAFGQNVDLNMYWQKCGNWYLSKNISQAQFQAFRFKGGFNTGDVIIVRGKPWTSIQVGDIIVWQARDGTPIIHRVVQITQTNGTRILQTKGDHNSDQITVGLRAETAIAQDQYIGVAQIRIPWLGNIKLFAARAVGWIGAHV